MSTAIAEILRQRIEDLAIVDKSAGLVRAIPRSVQVNGRPVTRYFPVGCNVSDPDSCTIQQIEDLVPSSNYASIIYFEDLGSTRRLVNIPGASAKTVRLRLVAWMNLNKLGPLCTTGDAFQNEIERTINADRYDLTPYKAMTHRVVGSPIKSNSIFAKYNYDEVNRQYLNWPYDYFAIDIETNFILQDGCEEPIVPSDSQCAPIPTRKRYPKDFSCEDLLDPATGLTAEQLGPDCLDCEGGGVCLPVTVHNSDDSYTEEVAAGGDLALPDSEITNTAAEPIASVPATNPYVIPDVSWTDTDGAPMTTPYGQSITCAECEPCEDGTVVVKDSAGVVLYTVPVESGGTVDQQINDSYVNAKDTDGNLLHVTGAKAQNYADQVIADGTVQPQDSNGDDIGSPVSVLAEGTAVAPIADSVITKPDDTTFGLPATQPLDIGDYLTDAQVDVNGVAFDTVPDAGTLDVPVLNSDLDPVGSKVGGDWKIADSTANLKDSAGGAISSTGIAAEASENITAPDGTVLVKDSAGTTLHTVPVKSNGTANQTVSDSSVVVKDSAGATLHTVPVKAEATANQTVSDSAIQLKDSAGTNIGAATNVKAEASANITAPDGSVQPKDSAGTNIGSAQAVKSNGTANVTIADSVITLMDDTTQNLKATAALNLHTVVPLKFVFALNGTTVTWTVTVEEKGIYTAYTQDGSSGTITYKLNAGSFTALSGTITLVAGDVITVKRTVKAAQGWSRWAH